MLVTILKDAPKRAQKSKSVLYSNNEVTPFLKDAVIIEMTTIGSLLLIAMGLNMLDITDIKVMNFVPAVFLPILFMAIF